VSTGDDSLTEKALESYLMIALLFTASGTWPLVVRSA
jgi:hypothetical protein